MNNENNIILDMKEVMENLKTVIDSLAVKEETKLKELLKDKTKMEDAVKSYLANKKDYKK